MRESEEHDGVDDTEGEHVSRDHAVDHRHERTRQLHRTAHRQVTLFHKHILLDILVLGGRPDAPGHVQFLALCLALS